jgi:hypothetical protein
VLFRFKLKIKFYAIKLTIRSLAECKVGSKDIWNFTSLNALQFCDSQKGKK